MKYCRVLAAFLLAFASSTGFTQDKTDPKETKAVIREMLEKWESLPRIWGPFAATQEKYLQQDIPVPEGSDVILDTNTKVPFVFGAEEMRYVRKGGHDILMRGIRTFNKKAVMFGNLVGPLIAFIRCEDGNVFVGNRLEIDVYPDVYFHKNRVRMVWANLYQDKEKVISYFSDNSVFVGPEDSGSGCSPAPDSRIPALQQ